jgi:AraC-like DNA-binding protein
MFASRVAARPFTTTNTLRTAARFALHFFILLTALTPSGLCAQHAVPADLLVSVEEEYAPSDLLKVNDVSFIVDDGLPSDASMKQETSIISYVTQIVVISAVVYIAYRSGQTATSFNLAIAADDEVSIGLRNTRRVTVAHPSPIVEYNAFVKKVKEIIASNYEEESFCLADLCVELRMSRSQLFRRLKAEANVAPSVLIRNYRLEQAREQLLNGAYSVKEVAYAVGFREPAHFSRAFREAYGVVPSSLLQKE